MAVEGDLSAAGCRYLLDCHCECEHLDYKVALNIGNDHNAIGIVKDIIGMKNTGGGYLLIGVEDKTWNPIGIDKTTGLDTKMLRDQVVKYSGLTIELDFIEHKITIDGEQRLFGLILVRASAKMNKLNNPSQCKKNVFQNEAWGIREGEIYVRDGDQTIKLTDLQRLREKIEDLQDRYQEADQLEATSIASPFEIDTGLFQLLPKEYEGFVGRKELLQKIKKAVEQDPRIWIINLYGPGGVGKSALATRVAYDYYESHKYEAILHLSAKDRELAPGKGVRSLLPSLVSLEDLLDKILRLFLFSECCSEDIEKKKNRVLEILTAFSTLIILDNMEAVSDGRIMEFVRAFPPETKAKVLLTSRQRNSDWEMPIQVPELSDLEIREFIKLRTEELQLDFPITNETVIQKISQISGGLPLAIQWILGDYARTKDLDSILKRVITNQSPLLEFSFRNSWKTLGSEAQEALAVLPIFNEPPTLQIWRTVLNWNVEKIERAKSKLIESTFVTEKTLNSGEQIFKALPITLSFAKLELEKMQNLACETRTRYQEFTQRISLSAEQVSQSEDLFGRFDAIGESQKKAILLARMAEGQLLTLGYQEAEEYYQQALDIDPHSVYALVSYGKFKANLFEFDEAIDFIIKALPKITKKSGFFIYYNLAEVYGQMKEWKQKVKYIKEAMKYETSPYLFTLAQHSLGVALGKTGDHIEAIQNFDQIIEREFKKDYLSKSFIVAARTKKISLNRTNPSKTKEYLNDLIMRCKQHDSAETVVEELIHIRDHE
ncbi:MAG: NB-ARC domain-containing protein [Anaerolineaceae bacterium]